jgi:hypothetical protein
MIQQFYQRILVSRQASVFALLAALLLASTPALEAAHDHDTGAAYAECLLCKQASDLPVASAPAALTVTIAPARIEAPVASVVHPRAFSNYAPRGPPSIF